VDLLAEYGVDSFDAFRAVFCDTTSDMELDVARSFRRVERLSRYKSLGFPPLTGHVVMRLAEAGTDGS
jgi:N12 class adenine-specific DNA methylase